MFLIFTEREIANILREIDVESKVIPKYEPKIVNVVYDSREEILYIVVLDRPDKSSLIGYGGLRVKKLKEKLGVKDVTVITYVDLLVKKRRIKGALEKLNTILNHLKNPIEKRVLQNYVKKLLEAELRYPPRTIPCLEKTDIVVPVAYSGGVDSTATLYLLWRLGLKPIALTVDPGPFIIPDDIKERIVKATKKLNLEHHFIKPKESFDEVINAALEGKVIPCSLCYPILIKTMYEWVKNKGMSLIFFGDLLSTSYSSIMFIDDYRVIRVNLPGALSLTKFDTKFISSKVLNETTDHIYGCPLLREAFRRHRWAKFIAYGRVLRETRAGILEPMEALRYIKKIDKAYYSYFTKYFRNP